MVLNFSLIKKEEGKTNKSSVGKDKKQLEFSYITGGNIN